MWTNVYQADAIAQAKNFINNNYVKSGIVTGTQWDVTMGFVNGKNDGYGNKFYVTTPLNARHSSENVRGAGSNEYDKVCNIYDLEGNARELSAERFTWWFSGEVQPEYIVSRGGFCTINDYPAYASARIGENDYASWASTFRMVLYVM